jgi:dolichyl-phosphate-mannose-protein mannosyltransferase
MSYDEAASRAPSQPGPVSCAPAGPGPVPAGGPPPARSARLAAGLIAAGAIALEMAVSTRYGYHRDELYFLQAGLHPAAGYVDQPPLTPLAARAATALFGGSLTGLRLLPALLLGLMTMATAAMSRALGASRAGQVVAALATAACAEYLAAAHLLSTTTLDFAFWAVTLWCVVRLLGSQDPRWWLAAGACAGAGASAKWTIGMLVAAVAAGVALAGPRHLLRSRYVPLACLLAAAGAAPDVIWQATHGWPNVAVFGALAGQAGHNRAVYWPAQVIYTGLVLTPLWAAGLAWCLRAAEGRRFRAAGIAAAGCLAGFWLLGGKPYYAGAVYTFLFAAGSVPAGRWLARASARARVPAAAALVASTGLAAVLALPLVPARVLHSVPLQKVNYDLGETIGWPGLTALVAREYWALPPPQRAHTVILAANYGEAGAIDRFGPAYRLPPAYSGANNFWYWGPPPATGTGAIAVNVDPALLRELFTSVRQVATFHNGLGVADNEQGAAVYRAVGLRVPWARAWPRLRNFS